MKIVLGSHYFNPHVGGIETVVESHAERLASRGHDITVVSSNVGTDSLESQQNGYKIRRFKAWNPVETLGAPYPVPKPTNVKTRLRDILADEEIDIFHVHGLNYLTTTAMLRHIPSHCPVVMHQHTPFVEYPLPFKLLELINDHTIGRWNLRQSDLVFCINQEIEQYVNKLEPTAKTELLMNGVDTDVFSPDCSNMENIFDCDPETPVFFTLSRMSQKKGIDVLLEAVRNLDQKNTDIHFAIAGDGPMLKEVNETAQEAENIEVLGRISDEKLSNAYAHSDAFIFSSKSGEAFPTLTMIEALASGTPVIASELAASPIGIRDKVNSILVEPGNPQELTKAIIKLSEEKKQRLEMSSKAREAAIESFSIKDRIDRLEDCYMSLVETERKSSSSFSTL